MPALGPESVTFPKPTNTLDIVVVSVITTGSVIMLAGAIVILLNRNYRPIKTKSVPLTLLSSLGGLIWITATLIVNDHFARKKGSFLSICVFWTYWLQACFGFALWLNCLILRLITLYNIFIRKVRPGKFYFLLLLPLMLPTIIYSSTASGSKSLVYNEKPGTDSGDCQFDKKRFWASGLMILLLFNYIIFIWFAFRLRNIMAQYNEFRLIRRGGILSLFLFLLSLVTIKTQTYDTPVGRCYLSATVAFSVFYFFWARNGAVIYNVLFHRETYLSQYNADLNRLPSEHEREAPSHSLVRMESQLKSIRDEVQKYRGIIHQLEEEVKSLEAQEKTTLLSTHGKDISAAENLQ